MALFKIFNNANTKNNLPENYKAGYCYFDVNTGKFYIDTIDDNKNGRIPISGEMADKLRTARTITLNGDVTGSTTFDGSGDVTITAAVAADSHAHDTQYLRRDGNNTMTGNLTFSDNTFCKDILINGAVKQHRLSAYDNAASNAVWIFSSRENGATNWKSLLTISMDGTVSASTFKGALNGNADTASKFKTAQTITVAGDATGTVTFDGSKAQTLSLDVGSADQLSSNYKINGTAFNGSKDITTASWGAARNVSITDGTNTGTATSMGTATSGSYSLKLPTTIKATLTGNASTATALAKAVTIALAGDVSGSASFTGAGDITINTEVADDSHLHTYLQASRGGTVSAATLTVPDGQAKFYFRITNASTGLFPHDNAANAILAISKHEGSYQSQLGFSNNGSLYYRSENGTAFTDETAWKKLAFTSDNVESANKWKTARTLTLKGGANGNVTFDGSENVECEVTITNDSHTHDSTYIRRDGATPITGDLSFNYLSNSTPGYLTWTQGTVLERVKIADSASDSTETFTFQRSTDSGTTWTDLLKIAGDSTIYATKFNGALVGNASSATQWQTKRTITLTGGATGSVEIDGSSNENLAVTVTNDGHHHSNSTIDNLDASKITSGTISISRLPQGALERLVVVADDTARFKLTTSNVQLGDVVKVTATDVMYFVKDTANLSNANGYELFAAGRAASVNWANIQNVPTLNFSGDVTGSIALAGEAANGKNVSITVGQAAQLTTARNINGTAFNGTKAITTATWGTARNVTIKDADNTNAGAATSMGASTSDYVLHLPTTIKATLSGNAATATKLATARDISLGGDVTGTATAFDGTKAITINTVVNSAQTGFAVNAASSNASLVVMSLMRPGAVSSWRFRNQAGVFYLDNNYTTAKTDWFPVITVNYNNGNTTFKGNVTAPKFIGTLQGNADTASKWATTRKFALTGDVTGETTIDGSGNISMEATVLDDSHAHNYLGKKYYIAYPAGNTYYASGTSTGALQITLPVKWTQNMMKFTVSIYNYLTGTAVDYVIGGYNFNDGKWYNPTAICLGKAGAALSNLKVRFCTDGTNPCITIGEIDTTWYYAAISIHDITWGNESNYSDFIKTWKMAFVTTLPTTHHTVENTHVGYNSVASSCLGNSATASKWATAQKLTLSGDVTGEVSFDGSGAISLTTTVADESHYHNTTYLRRDGGNTMTGNLTFASTSNADRYISFLTGTTASMSTHNWRIGYLGTGSSDANYLAFQSTKSTTDTWSTALTLGCQTLNAIFYGTVKADKGFIGNASTATAFETAQTITVAGDATGTVEFNGTEAKTLTLDVATAAKTDYALTVNVTNVADTLTTTTFNGSAAKTININASDFMPLTSFTKTLTLTTSWQDIGISSNNIANSGSYIIQVLVNDGGTTGTLSNYSEYYTGVMSWYASNTNSTDTDEIILHKAGHASNSRYIYLRTVRTSAGTLKMQIAANVTATAASTLAIKVRQLI